MNLKFEISNLKFTRTQGSNILDGIQLKLMIKEDHLLACTTRMIEIQIALPSLKLSRERAFRESNDLDRLDNHCCTQQFLGTHPRGLSDYSLVKELVTANVVNNFRHSQRSFFSSHSNVGSVWGRRIVSSVFNLSTARSDFLFVSFLSGYVIGLTPPKQ
jgi:hypothetical protein